MGILLEKSIESLLSHYFTTTGHDPKRVQSGSNGYKRTVRLVTP